MEIKIVFVFIILLLSVMPVDAADLNPQDAGEGMIKGGFDLIIISAADGLNSIWKDNMFSNGFNNNTNVSKQYGATRSAIFTFVSVNPQPATIEPIAAFEKKTVYVWAFLVFLFIFWTPIRNVLARANYSTYSSAFGDTDFSDSKYVGTLILLLASYFAPQFITFVLDICTVISQYAMLNVLDYIEPSLENAWVYLFMAIVEFGLSIFFVIRPWIIDVVYAASRLLAVWYFVGIWRGESSWVWQRFFKIVSLQPVCIFVACVFLIGIKWAGMENGAGGYLIMFAILFYLCYKWTVGDFNLPSKIGRLAFRRGL
jgi:hypothetical protein